ANAVRAVGRLIFHCRIPPWVEVNYRVRPREVEADTARLEADEEHGNRRGLLKTLHDFAAIRRRAVEVTVFNALRRQLFLEQREHRDELAEHEHAMPAVDDFLQQLAE